jgi:glucokinase
MPSVAAVDLGGTKVAVAEVSSRGTLRGRVIEPVDTSSPSAAVEQIVRLVRQIDHEAVGIAVPGLARRDGTVWAPNLPGWDAMPLARLVRQKVKVPVAVESDRNAVVIGESWRGAAKGRSDVVTLIIGTGIGAGIISDGKLIRGSRELSGCTGWMVVADETNAETPRAGSLEALAAGPAIARLSGATDAIALAERARDGDSKARAAFARAGRLLGLAVANLINTLDPEVVVLTGGLTAAADLFLDELRAAAIERGQPLAAPHVDILVSALGADANLLGAARIALEELGARRS